MLEKEYSTGPQNIITDEYQMIRLSEGYCPHKCPWCYEPKMAIPKQDYILPEIVRRDIRLTDMNILASHDPLSKINQFHDLRINGKVIYPWLICGIDYRFMTKEIAEALKYNRFIKIHIAWDSKFSDQFKIRNTLNILKKAGYKKIGCFMICNHPMVSYSECLLKLNLCKYWNVTVKDCYFDNQVSPNIIPIGWTIEQIKEFRKQVRKHNQIVAFGADPKLKKEN